MKKAIKITVILILLISALLLLQNTFRFIKTPENADIDTDNAPLGFTVYFLDVGQANSALIVCDGKTMLIDGGNSSDSDFIYSFLRNHEIAHLDYIVATHAHEDHVGGLAGALNYATVGVALSPVAEYDSRAFNSFVKYLDEQGVSITVPSHGDTFELGSADVLMVAPVGMYSDHNNMSIVIKVTYGETSFLFTGDAERQSEQDILDAVYGSQSETFDLSATVLKVGHHGSDTSTTYPFLREIMPQYAVISCGTDNPYGHPHENLLSRLRDAEVILYRTDMQGTIVCTSDGETVSFSVQRNSDIETNPTKPIVDEPYYIGNKNSLVYHRPSCSGLPAEHNQVVMDTFEIAVNEGYRSCNRCNPPGLFNASHKKIAADEAMQIMSENDEYVLLDVRTEDEYAQEHIPGAILIPHTEVSDKASDMLPDKDMIILVYCQAGVRSASAAGILAEMGYTRVYDIGGIADWQYERGCGRAQRGAQVQKKRTLISINIKISVL